MKVVPFMIVFAVLGASAAQAKNPYLGTDVEDIQAGIAKVMGQELAKERQRGRDIQSPSGDSVEPPPKTAPVSPNWDDEVRREVIPAKESVSPIPAVPLVPATPPAAPRRPFRSVTPLEEAIIEGWRPTPMRPTQQKGPRPADSITIPAGSFITGELFTGVDAPAAGDAIPALIRLHQGFSGPNDGFVDMSGCHAIAKANGDLSTERVKFQTTTLSCLSPTGGRVELDMGSFAAGVDGSFGVPGKLNSRQGQVALMAFMNGVVEGATKVVSNPSVQGMDNPSLNAGSLGSQGGSSAATEVVRWYLEHARGLMPSVEVFAGTSIRLVLLQPLTVPKSYFRKFHKPQKKGVSDEDVDFLF